MGAQSLLLRAVPSPLLREVETLVREKLYDAARGPRPPERLEGPGVKPDVAVPSDLPYAEGRDPQLERALEVAAGLLKAP